MLPTRCCCCGKSKYLPVASCAMLPFDSCKINLCENAQLMKATHVETLHKAGFPGKAKQIGNIKERERKR